MNINRILYVIKNLPSIIRGFFNFYFGRHAEIRRERLFICRTNECGHYDAKGESELAFVPGKESCGACGCVLKAKTSDMQAYCTMKDFGKPAYWDAVLKENK